MAVGLAVGLAVGWAVGSAVGLSVGLAVGNGGLGHTFSLASDARSADKSLRGEKFGMAAMLYAKCGLGRLWMTLGAQRRENFAFASFELWQKTRR